MPETTGDFDPDTFVTVVVDGAEGWRGDYREILQKGLSYIVSNIEKARLESRIEEQIEAGMKPDDPYIQELKRVGPGLPDSVCIAREGKSITTPQELGRMKQFSQLGRRRL